MRQTRPHRHDPALPGVRLGGEGGRPVTPDDPRHGQPRGWYAHRRDGEDPCRDCKQAVRRYNNLRRMGRVHPQVSALGTTRRLRALMAIGWDQRTLATHLGWGNTRVSNLVRGLNSEVTWSTAERVRVVYDRLHMTPMDGTFAARLVRTLARRQGWAAPLAWDDIDHDPEPAGGAVVDAVDPVVVDRILAGEWRLPATREERVEVCRRFPGTTYQLASLVAWKPERYWKRSAA